MPRYFFIVTIAGRAVEDTVGATYQGPIQACEAAERIARDLAEDPAFSGCTVEVVDEARASIGTVIAPG